MRSLCQRLQRQVIIRHGRFGDGCHPTRYYPSVPTQGYSSRCDTKGYTYHRYTSSASVVDKARRVTRCRDARSERPLYQKLQHRSFNDNGRTHRSAPTKGYTYHRYTSSASVVDKARRVTRCRDARPERPLYQKLQHRSFNDNGRPLARY